MVRLTVQRIKMKSICRVMYCYIITVVFYNMSIDEFMKHVEIIEEDINNNSIKDLEVTLD